MEFLIAIVVIIFFVDWLFTAEKVEPTTMGIKMTKLSQILIIFWVNIFYICCTCKFLEWLGTDDLNFYGRVLQVFVVTIGILKPIWNIYKMGFDTFKEYKEFVNQRNSKM